MIVSQSLKELKMTMTRFKKLNQKTKMRLALKSKKRSNINVAYLILEGFRVEVNVEEIEMVMVKEVEDKEVHKVEEEEVE